jgi:hypothetical protein
LGIANFPPVAFGQRLVIDMVDTCRTDELEAPDGGSIVEQRITLAVHQRDLARPIVYHWLGALVPATPKIDVIVAANKAFPGDCKLGEFGCRSAPIGPQ